MTINEKYEFSFTTASLRLKEMTLVASHIYNGTEIDYINELGLGKRKTGRKMLSEFNKRIETLTKTQTALLVNGDLIIQQQIAFLSVCKCYGFIRDFVVEVLREKLLVFDYQITEGEYISFFRRKADFHPEIEKLTETTQIKIKQVTFKILEQAGIIDTVKNKVIQPQLIEESVIKVIVAEDAEWMKVFFMSDIDIANLNT
jgi:hypothetical protein